MNLILASKSPRRKTLLSLLGVDFEVREADVDENPFDDESPRDMTVRLAELKATTVLQAVGPEYSVLGGDTTVAIDNESLGKPESFNEAVSMLEKLSARTHSVFSAVSLASGDGCKSLVCETLVTFRELTDEEIHAYCNTSDPYDKAGGYGIQGGASKFVADLKGSYSNVVGLPLWHTHQLLFSGSTE